MDTGTLYNALTIGNPGNWLEDVKNGVKFGFGGPSRHPSGSATIADIAKFHDTGDGVPKRQIIVEPDSATVAAMVEDFKRAMKRIK